MFNISSYLYIKAAPEIIKNSVTPTFPTSPFAKLKSIPFNPVILNVSKWQLKWYTTIIIIDIALIKSK